MGLAIWKRQKLIKKRLLLMDCSGEHVSEQVHEKSSSVSACRLITGTLKGDECVCVQALHLLIKLLEVLNFEF